MEWGSSLRGWDGMGQGPEIRMGLGRDLRSGWNGQGPEVGMGWGSGRNVGGNCMENLV